MGKKALAPDRPTIDVCHETFVHHTAGQSGAMTNFTQVLPAKVIPKENVFATAEMDSPSGLNEKQAMAPKVPEKKALQKIPSITCEYEKLLTSQQQEICRDSLPELVRLPDDAFVVERYERETRTTEPPIPSSILDKQDIPIDVKQVIRSSTAARTAVFYKYTPHTQTDSQDDIAPIIRAGEANSFEIDEAASDGLQSTSALFAESSSQNITPKEPRRRDSYASQSGNRTDDYLQNKFVAQTPKNEVYDFALSEKSRPQAIADVLHRPSALLVPTNGRTRRAMNLTGRTVSCAPPYSVASEEVIRVRVDFQNLGLGMPTSVEPFYLSASLHDIEHDMRISEDFHFDFNSDETREKVNGASDSVHWATTSHSAVFHITPRDRLEDIAMIIKIEKSFQGEANAAIDPYSDPAAKKAFEKYAQGLETPFSHLRQPFAWGVYAISGAREDNSKTPVHQIPLYRADAEKYSYANLYQVLRAVLKKKTDQSYRRPRELTGYVSCDVRRLSTDALVESCVTPWLGRISTILPAGDHPVREIQEFDSYLTSSYGEFSNFLYIYPSKLDFSKRGNHARNIAVRIEVLAHEGAEPSKVIYGKSNTDTMQSTYHTSVLYHNKQPYMMDEVKILLPSRLTTEHHLKITFTHVAANKKKSARDALPPIGYAVVPLRGPLGNLLEDGVRNLPVAQELSTGYLSTIRAGMGGGCGMSQYDDKKWYENGKALFTVEVKGVTTVHTQSAAVLTFLTKAAMRRVDFDKASEAALLAATISLTNQTVEPLQLYRFLPTTVERLLWIICNTWGLPALSAGAFSTLVHVFSACHRVPPKPDGGNPLLDHYICESLDIIADTTVSLHAALVHVWISADRGSTELSVNSLKMCRHLFEMIAKSVALSHTAREGPVASAHDTDTFHSNLRLLSEWLGREVRQYSTKSLNLAKTVNEAFASFMQSCFSCTDRTFAFSLARDHLRSIPNDSPEVLLGLKLDFLMAICAHEHYVALNIPLETALENPSEYVWDNAHYHSHHALASVLVSEVVLLLHHREKNLRVRCIDELAGHLERLGKDSRYQSPASRHRIALLYFPFLLHVLDSSALLHRRPTAKDKPKATARASQAKAKAKPPVPDKGFGSEETRNILCCYLAIQANLTPEYLSSWWSQEKPGRLFALADVLSVCVTVFEYHGLASDSVSSRNSRNFGTLTPAETKQLIEERYSSMSQHGARKQLQARRAMADEKMSMSQDPACDSILEDSSVSEGCFRGRRDIPELQRAISVQCAAIVLSSVSLVLKGQAQTQQIKSPLKPRLPSVFFSEQPSSTQTYARLFILQKCLDVICGILSLNQSQATLVNTFIILREMCAEYPHMLFDESAENCAVVTSLVLNHSFSAFPLVRREAAATIYWLAKVNYKNNNNGNFTRVKMQLTLALSRRIRACPAQAPNLSLTLTLANSLSKNDNQLSKPGTRFSEGFSKLMFNLYGILDNTHRMKKYTDDPEMYVDLMYSIAIGYASSPVLRYTWLENIEKFHAQRGYWAERAMCTLHMCAIVADYLHGTNAMPYRPQGCEAFNIVSFNAASEKAEVQLENVMEVRNNSAFTETNLVKKLEQLVLDLKKAELLELAGAAYKLLIPIYEHMRAFDFLHVAYGHLSEVYRDVINVTNSQKRLLGTYFRVAFVGSLFEDIDGAEFVYKEPTVTTLAEVSLRLKDFYGGKYGVEKVHLLQDSGPINHDTLDPELAYIQVTHVEPFFDETERMNRITAFERVVNVNRFVFEAPYTLTGKSHGTVKEQCKRKTIVTTAKHFPYVRSRIAVVAIETINLTPVDVAIEAIKRKTEELNAVVSSKNIKMLQLVLSGAVSATVNEGPLGMAQAFIPIGDHSSMAEKKRKNIKLLQEAFALFLQACGLAVDLNTQMCLEDQQEYAQNLDEKYTAMLADFRPYLKEQQMPIIRRKMATLHNNSLSVRTLSASATISTNGLV